MLRLAKWHEYKIFAAIAISSFGSWLTFLATAMLLNEKYGSEHVTHAFLIQSLPAILFSSYTNRLVPEGKELQVYVALSLALAINVTVLGLNPSLTQIYIFMVVSSCLSAFARPLLQTLIVGWAPKERLRPILTRTGSINAIVLAIAPPIGGLLAGAIGYQALFFLDAASFIVAVFFLLALGTPQSIARRAQGRRLRWFKAAERGFPPALRKTVIGWYIFLIAGALFNGLEFYFFAAHGYDEYQIGFILGAWGIGNLIAFLTSSANAIDRIPKAIFPFGYAICFVAFVLSPSFLVTVAAFLVCSYTYAIITGFLRSELQASRPADMGDLTLWGLLSSRMGLINLVIYGVTSVLIRAAGVDSITVVAISMSALLFLLLAGVLRSSPKAKTPPADPTRMKAATGSSRDLQAGGAS